MKVLIAIDGSHYANEVLTEISYRDWPDNTEFYLITTLELTNDWETDQEYLDQASTVLDDRKRLLQSKIQSTMKIHAEIIEGPATQMITKTARDWGADLIIIGSHGDTGIRREKVGSVAAAVVNEAPCSVEVLKLFGKLYETPQAAMSTNAE